MNDIDLDKLEELARKVADAYAAYMASTSDDTLAWSAAVGMLRVATSHDVILGLTAAIRERQASLVDIVGVIRRTGGFLTTEDQQALFRAEQIIATAKVTP